MQQKYTNYNFRKRDYARIRNWYELTKYHYVPEDTIQIIKPEKCKSWHHRFSFKEIRLYQSYAFKHLKDMNNIKEVILLSSIYHKSKGIILTHGKELIKESSFDQTNSVITLKDEAFYYFYIQDIQLLDYYFCLQVRIVSKQGNCFKIGQCKHPLNPAYQIIKNKFMLSNNAIQQFKIEQESISKQHIKMKNKQVDIPNNLIGEIDFDQNLADIDIQKYLPSLKIIDLQAKIPPINSLNLKSKKDQYTIDPSYKVVLEQLIIRIENPEFLKKQILGRNPFTLSHKDLVHLQIKSYKLILDMHNGWKFLRNNKNYIIMELVIQNEKQIYISSKKAQNIAFNYYQSDYMIFLAIITCQVEFILKGVTQQKRVQEFMTGWLPLPLDLSLKQNKIDMFFVNDMPFPASITPLLSINSTLTAVISHPQHTKYKPRPDDKKIPMHELPLPQIQATDVIKYAKLTSRKVITTSNSQQQQQLNERLEKEIQKMKQIIDQDQKQKQKVRLVNLVGRGGLGEKKQNKEFKLQMEQCVGRILKIKLEIKSLIPETNTLSQYYLPKKLRCQLYFLRHYFEFNSYISQNSAKYHIPVSMNGNKMSFHLRHQVTTVRQYESIINSNLIIVLYEEGMDKFYAKGVTNIMEVLGEKGVEQVSYVNLKNWNNNLQAYQCFGTILVNSVYQIQKTNASNTKVQEFQINKHLHKLSAEDRMKMRIGNYKGDFDMKAKTVSVLKQKQHKQFIKEAVENEMVNDGLIQYELGVDSYYLLPFVNEDKSENNVFTFHLLCTYAEIVTNQQQFRTVTTSLNVQSQNFKQLKYIFKESHMSYYQTSLQYNQQIGLLIKLHYSEIGINQPSKIQILVKRNTLQNKRFLLRCKYKQPLVWDVITTQDILIQSNQLRLPIDQQLIRNYKNIVVLNQSIKYDPKNKQLVLQKYSLSAMKIYIQATQIQSKVKKIIVYQINLLSGREFKVIAGQRFTTFFELESQSSVHIIRNYDRQVYISNPIRFNIQSNEQQQKIEFKFMKPQKSKKITIHSFDMFGKRISSNLFKFEVLMPSDCKRIEINQQNNISIPIHCENPYACSCFFQLISSSNTLKFDENSIQLNGYGSKLVLGKIIEWGYNSNIIYVHLLDKRGNSVQTTQIHLVKLNQAKIIQNE